MRKGRQIADRLSACCWLALAGLLPVVFFPGGRDSFGPAKRDTFCILAVGQLLLTAVRWAPEWREFVRRLARTPVCLPACAAAVIALAGQAAGLGGWRPPADALDVVLGAGLCLCLTADSGIAPTGKMIGITAVSTGLAACYAIVQFLGLDLFTWRTGFAGGAPGATYGNPLFLADGLLVVLPAAVAGILVLRGAARAASFGLACLVGYALLLTQARGAWIGCAAALAVLGWGIRTRRFRVEASGSRWLAALAVVGVVAAVLLSVPGPHNPGKASVAETVRSMGHPGTSGLAGRLLIWEAAARMTRDRPVVGWGPGSVRILYGIYQAPLLAEPRYAPLPFHSTLHAHDDLLQSLAERGVAGTGIFVWLIVASMAAWVKRRNISPAVMAAGCGLIGWLVDGVVNGPLHLRPSSMQVWIVLGLIGRTEEAAGTVGGSATRGRAAWWIAVAAAAIVLGRPFVRDLLAEGWFRAGADALDRGAAAEAVPRLARADAFALEDRRHQYQIGRGWFMLGRWADAAAAFREDAARNPGAHSAWFNLGVAEWRAGRPVEARRAVEYALALKPGDAESLRFLRNPR